MSDIDTAVVVDGLKALDPKWPIREADIGSGVRPNRFISRHRPMTDPLRRSWRARVDLDQCALPIPQYVRHGGLSLHTEASMKPLSEQLADLGCIKC